MPQIVRECDGFAEVRVETQRHRDAARHLCDLERVGEARPVVVAFERREYLRLALHAAKRSAVDHAISVTLERGP